MATKGLFHRAHYNGIAKDIREQYERVIQTTNGGFDAEPIDLTIRLAGSSTLAELAIRFAQRFKHDNDEFDPVQFLNQCSPNEDLYPLGELWDE